ncbi:MMPL family transporter [Paractinoplanes durhamensis]|uniref:MMPL family transporter n=1 Tax=Paractinoplanes durhamensis TaxID=113563 RepID=UPI00363692B3
MAAVVFGLSTDYEVFLLSRMVEARTRGASTNEAVTTGLARTGRVISAAALLLIVVTGAFAMSSITTMRFVGVGMIIALLLDATVVRMLLVPAVLRLLGDAAWWAPGPLRRLQEKAGLAEYETEAPAATTGRHALPDDTQVLTYRPSPFALPAASPDFPWADPEVSGEIVATRALPAADTKHALPAGSNDETQVFTRFEETQVLSLPAAPDARVVADEDPVDAEIVDPISLFTQPDVPVLREFDPEVTATRLAELSGFLPAAPRYDAPASRPSSSEDSFFFGSPGAPPSGPLALPAGLTRFDNPFDKDRPASSIPVIPGMSLPVDPHAEPDRYDKPVTPIFASTAAEPPVGPTRTTTSLPSRSPAPRSNLPTRPSSSSSPRPPQSRSPRPRSSHSRRPASSRMPQTSTRMLPRTLGRSAEPPPRRPPQTTSSPQLEPHPSPSPRPHSSRPPWLNRSRQSRPRRRQPQQRTSSRSRPPLPSRSPRPRRRSRPRPRKSQKHSSKLGRPSPPLPRATTATPSPSPRRPFPLRRQPPPTPALLRKLSPSRSRFLVGGFPARRRTGPTSRRRSLVTRSMRGRPVPARAGMRHSTRSSTLGRPRPSSGRIRSRRITRTPRRPPSRPGRRLISPPDRRRPSGHARRPAAGAPLIEPFRRHRVVVHPGMAGTASPPGYPRRSAVLPADHPPVPGAAAHDRERTAATPAAEPVPRRPADLADHLRESRPADLSDYTEGRIPRMRRPLDGPPAEPGFTRRNEGPAAPSPEPSATAKRPATLADHMSRRAETASTRDTTDHDE